MSTAVAALPLEAGAIADLYIREGVLPAVQRLDALHVATAALLRADYLVSWNFRHLVNVRRKARLHAVHTLYGLPHIDIISPPEIA